MEEITVHKVKFSLAELTQALELTDEVTYAYVSTYGEGYIELTLKK